MSSSRKNSLYRTSLSGTAVSTDTIFTYAIPEDTTILAQVNLVFADATNAPPLGSAVFISNIGVKRLGNAAAANVLSTNTATFSKIDSAIASSGAPAATWSASGNNLILTLTVSTVVSIAYYFCTIELWIN